MNKILKILGSIFLVIGIMMLSAGLYFKISFEEFRKNAKETTAVITSISGTGDSNNVLVEFIVDGTRYSGSLNYYNSNMYVGKEEKIYYQIDNPNKFKSKNKKNLLSVVFLIIGAVFPILGILFLVIPILKSKKQKRVLSYNYVIQASIVGCSIDTTVSINGRCPYRLEANYISPLDGKLYSYKSDELWADVTPILTQRQITTIPVYVNPNNYAEYYMDISALKNLIGN